MQNGDNMTNDVINNHTDLFFNNLTPYEYSKEELGIYNNALDHVFDLPVLKNIGICGNYGSGKTSIIQSYFNNKKTEERKFFFLRTKKFSCLTISLADFKRSKKNNQKEPTRNISIEDKLEGRIINHLLQKVDNKNIPRSSIFIKGENNFFTMCSIAVSFILLTLSLLFLILSTFRANVLDEISLLETYKNKLMALSVVILMVLSIICLLWLYRHGKLRRMFKTVSFKGNSIELFSEEKFAYFDKYLDEVVYLFRHCGYKNIIFDDIDRNEQIEIFTRLREINNLINEKDAKQPIRFFYIMKDDLFDPEEKAKFFDYIITVVPVVSNSNSYDKLLGILKESNIDFREFSDGFLRDVSFYISDFRLLKSIVNDFIVYRQTVNINNRDYNRLLSLMLYKNLFPKDYNRFQTGEGFVKEEVLDTVKNEGFNDTIINNAFISIDLDCEKNGNESKYIEIASSRYKNLLEYLLKNRYIDRASIDYTCAYSEHEMTHNDREYIHSVKEHNALDYDYNIDAPAQLLAYLQKTDYALEAILNINIIDALIENIEDDEGTDKLKLLVDSIYERSNLEFASKFILEGTHIDIFVKQLIKTWPQFIEDLKLKIGEDEANQCARKVLQTKQTDALCFLNSDFTNSISNLSAVINFETNKTDQIIDNMKTWGVKLNDVRKCKMDNDLWKGIYDNNLYAFNYSNILYVLTNYHHYELEKVKHSILSCIINLKDALTNYAEENIDSLIASAVGNAKDLIIDDDETINYILGNKEIKSELKNLYVASLKTQVNDISIFEQSSILLLPAENMIPNAINTLTLFSSEGKRITGKMLALINAEEYKFEKDDMLMKRVSELDMNTFRNVILTCDNISDESYAKIMDAMNEPIKISEHTGISLEKMRILIAHRIVNMTAENLLFIRKRYSDLRQEYIRDNANEYMKIVDGSTFIDREVQYLIQGCSAEKAVNDFIKRYATDSCKIPIHGLVKPTSTLKLIMESYFDENDLEYVLTDLPVKNKSLQDTAANICTKYYKTVLEKNIIVNVSILKKALTKNVMDAQYQKMIMIPAMAKIDESAAIECFKSFKDKDFIDLLSKKTRKDIELNDVNRRFYKALEDRKWISSVTEKGNVLKVNGKGKPLLRYSK